MFITFGARTGGKPRAALLQVIEAEHGLNTGSRDTNRTVRAPGCLEQEAFVIGGSLDAKQVVHLDGGSVAGGRTVITAVIGPHHVDTGTEMIHKRAPIGQGLPRAVA